MAKDKKKDDWDTGITVAPMNGDELPKYRRMAYLNRAKRPSKEERLKHKHMYTKKERRAIIRAGLLAMLPQFLIIIVAFGIVIGLIYLWLS
ncbi:MAG: hypothetical protein K2N18_04400 [Clostridia bacterium]|nr:hypothetical protein [Clostridia bacterium]